MYLDLKTEKGVRFYYRESHLENIIEELDNFLSFDKGMNNLDFAKKMMFSHELKFNNQVEGYGDDLKTIEYIIKTSSKDIKDDALRQRILNLYYGYYYIMHHKKQDKEHLQELYNILSNKLLSEYDINHMGEYREAPVYILQNGRLDMELEEGVDYKNISSLMDNYFTYISDQNETDKTKIYLRSQIMHFYFVYIHPFFDVNGRTSRTMAMWYLLNNKAYPYIIFNRGISFIGSNYDRLIKDAKESKDLTKFLEMMMITLKKELEKEHVVRELTSNTKYELNSIYYQVLLYYLTMSNPITLRDFAVMYNRFNAKKSIREIYEEMIKPLVDMDIFVVTRYAKRSIGDIPNIEFILNEKKYDKDCPYLRRIK